MTDELKTTSTVRVAQFREALDTLTMALRKLPRKHSAADQPVLVADRVYVIADQINALVAQFAEAAEAREPQQALIETWRSKAAVNDASAEQLPAADLKLGASCWAECRRECADELAAALNVEAREPRPAAAEKAVFTAGWHAAERNEAAAEDEDIADAPDVAFLDYVKSGRETAPQGTKQ